jgi:flagellin-like hook-associated protein FlgL
VRLATAVSSATSNSRNLQSLLTYAQTQEGMLRELSKVLMRMGELVTRISNPLMSDEDRGQFVLELGDLADEIESIGNSAFNGIELFKMPADGADPSVVGATQLTGSLQSDPDPLEGSDTDSEFSKLTVDLGGSHSVSVTKHSLNFTTSNGTRTLYDIVLTFGRLSTKTPEELGKYLVKGSLDLSAMTQDEIDALYTDPTISTEELDLALNYKASLFPVALEQVNAVLAQNQAEQGALRMAVSGVDEYATQMGVAADSVTGTDLAKEASDITKLSVINRAAASVFYESNQSNAYLLKLL